jgi:hypothetical protein
LSVGGSITHIPRPVNWGRLLRWAGRSGMGAAGRLRRPAAPTPSRWWSLLRLALMAAVGKHLSAGLASRSRRGGRYPLPPSAGAECCPREDMAKVPLGCRRRPPREDMAGERWACGGREGGEGSGARGRATVARTTLFWRERMGRAAAALRGPSWSDPPPNPRFGEGVAGVGRAADLASDVFPYRMSMASPKE